MKHGKGAQKASSAKKTPSKGSGKAQGKPHKEGRSAKGSASRGTAGQAAAARTNAKGGDGRTNRSAAITFSNPAIANAFRRALKKYSTALRRLTD